VLPIVIVVLGFFISKMGALFEIRQQKLDDLNNVLQEDLSGMRVVKAVVF